MTKLRQRKPARVLLPRRTNPLQPAPGLLLLARAKTWTWPHWPCVVTAVQTQPFVRLSVRFYPDATTADIDPMDCLDFTPQQVDRVLEYARSKPRTKKDIPALLQAVQVARAEFMETNSLEKSPEDEKIQLEVDKEQLVGDDIQATENEQLAVQQSDIANKGPQKRMRVGMDEEDIKREKVIPKISEEKADGELSDCTESVSTVVTYSNRNVPKRLELIEKAPNLPVRKRWLVKTPMSNLPIEQTEMDAQGTVENTDGLEKLCEVDTNIIHMNEAD